MEVGFVLMEEDEAEDEDSMSERDVRWRISLLLDWKEQVGIDRSGPRVNK